MHLFIKRQNDFKVSDSDCWHYDHNCAASVVVVYTLQLQHSSILYYYTVAEMHIFLSEVDLSRLASRSRVLKGALKTRDWKMQESERYGKRKFQKCVSDCTDWAHRVETDSNVPAAQRWAESKDDFLGVLKVNLSNYWWFVLKCFGNKHIYIEHTSSNRFWHYYLLRLRRPVV